MDYFGPTVNLAARITRLAQGGEVFVSAASVEASGQQSDEGWETLQPQPVKGFAEPVSLMRFPR
jgi:class 3 adenylate cyclase